MVNLGKGFGAQLRGHFENLFRVIMVTKNLYDRRCMCAVRGPLRHLGAIFISVCLRAPICSPRASIYSWDSR